MKPHTLIKGEIHLNEIHYLEIRDVSRGRDFAIRRQVRDPKFLSQIGKKPNIFKSTL